MILEFTLIISILLLIVGGMFDLGSGIFRLSLINNALNSGIAYATINGYDVDGIKNAINNNCGTLCQASPDPVQQCECPNNVATTCNSLCPDNSLAISYVTIYVSYTLPMLFLPYTTNIMQLTATVATP